MGAIHRPAVRLARVRAVVAASALKRFFAGAGLMRLLPAGFRAGLGVAEPAVTVTVNGVVAGSTFALASVLRSEVDGIGGHDELA